MTTPNRQPAGVPVGGQFATATHSEPDVTLRRPTADTGFAEERLHDLDLAGRLDGRQIGEVTRLLNESLDFSDANIQSVTDSVHLRDFGVTATDVRTAKNLGEELRALGRTADADALVRIANAAAPDEPHDSFLSHEEFEALAEQLLPDGKTEPVPASDPRLQAGQVFDKITDDHGTVFHRRRPGSFAGTPYAMRFQANRPLTEEEQSQAASLIGYTYAATIRGENIGYPEQDTPFSFVVAADMTKSRRDDLGDGLAEFEDQLPYLLQGGSPIRTTGKKGPVGSRLIEGFNDPDLKFEIYYDDVFEPQN